jgi:hypothetical protein
MPKRFQKWQTLSESEKEQVSVSSKESACPICGRPGGRGWRRHLSQSHEVPVTHLPTDARLVTDEEKRLNVKRRNKRYQVKKERERGRLELELNPMWACGQVQEVEQENSPR